MVKRDKSGGTREADERKREKHKRSVSDAKSTEYARPCALSCPEGGEKRVILSKQQKEHA